MTATVTSRPALHSARFVPLALGLLTLLATAATIPLSVAARQSVLGNSIQNLVPSLPYAAVGIVVIRKLPRNPVGWLLAALGILSVVSTDAGSYALLAHRHASQLPLGQAAAWLDESFRPVVVLLPLAILLFPDGRLPSARWRWVLRSYLAFSAAYVVVLIASALSAPAGRGVQIDAAGGLTAIDQPHGWSAAVEETLDCCSTWRRGRYSSPARRSGGGPRTGISASSSSG